MVLDIKICGLKTEEALRTALDCGASHIGFVFFEKSPRNLALTTANQLRRIAGSSAKVVAVTVNANNAVLEQIVESVQPDMLQLHGQESPERVAEIGALFGVPILKAIPVREAADLETLAPFENLAARFLLDAKPPEGAILPGGNGVPFDWTLLAALDGRVDYMLSGGLNAANVRDALRLARPRGIDVSSGVERAPGEKDPEKIHAFFAAVRSAKAADDVV